MIEHLIENILIKKSDQILNLEGFVLVHDIWFVLSVGVVQLYTLVFSTLETSDRNHIQT